jgi:hypothetical protein
MVGKDRLMAVHLMITAKAIPTKVRRGFVSGIASNKSQSISVPGNA